MSINAAELPQHALGQIFSHLNPQDLGRVAQVCRNWNAASKPEWIWQHVARSILDLSEPPKGSSWREQCLTLRRWERWKPEEIPLSSSSKYIQDHNALHHQEFFALLEDSTAFEVVRTDPSRLGFFSVRDLFDHKELSQINLRQYGCGDVSRTAGHKTMLVVRDVNGNIFQFDIRTGTCINQFTGEAPQDGSPSVLYCNDHEIISSVCNRVQIWDLNQRQLKQNFCIEGRDIWKIRSTPNFVLCLTYGSGSLFMVGINKKDPTMQTRLKTGFGIGVASEAFECSGPYCAVFTHNRKDLLIYEDTPGAQLQLVRTHHIYTEIPDAQENALAMYKHWVCIHSGGALHIFDVRNGRKVVSLNGNWGTQVSFQINAQALLAFHQFYDTCHAKSSHFMLYDFSGKMHQEPSSS